MTPKPKLYFNAFKCLLRYKGADLDYVAMNAHIRQCFGLRQNIQLDLMPPDKYKRIPVRYTAEFDSMKQTPASIVFKGQQALALERIRKWYEDPNAPQKFILFGWAGTGKSTLAAEVAKWGITVAVSYTGIAALELAKRGLDAMTIHSFVYAPQMNMATGEMQYNLRVPTVLPDLIILDECATVDEELDADLTSFGVKILAMGDPFQLPAISGKSPYNNSVKPDFQLTEIHRQALDNPIVWISREVREGRKLKIGKYGESRIVTQAGARKRLDTLLLDHLGDSKSIVGTNNTRIAYNKRVRKLQRYTGVLPHPGESLICLKNEKVRGLVNGQIWTVLEASVAFRKTCTYQKFDRFTGEYNERVSTWSHDEPGPYGTPVTVEAITLKLKNSSNGDILDRVTVPTAFFYGTGDHLHWKQRYGNSEFDFGYALTTHKAQGSTFLNVFVLDESGYFPEPNRWLYSAITRPSNNLILAINK